MTYFSTLFIISVSHGYTNATVWEWSDCSQKLVDIKMFACAFLNVKPPLLFNISSNVILTTVDTDAHYLLKPHISLLHFMYPLCKCFQNTGWLSSFSISFFQPEQFSTSRLIPHGSLSGQMIREKREFKSCENFRHEFNVKDWLMLSDAGLTGYRRHIEHKSRSP